jgi:hypothetical protein
MQGKDGMVAGFIKNPPEKCKYAFSKKNNFFIQQLEIYVGLYLIKQCNRLHEYFIINPKKGFIFQNTEKTVCSAHQKNR